jgi:hypothetical protein
MVGLRAYGGYPDIEAVNVHLIDSLCIGSEECATDRIHYRSAISRLLWRRLVSAFLSALDQAGEKRSEATRKIHDGEKQDNDRARAAPLQKG